MLFWRIWHTLTVVNRLKKTIFSAFADKGVTKAYLKLFLAFLCFCILFWAAHNDPFWEPLMSRTSLALIMGVTFRVGTFLSQEILHPFLKRYLLEFMAAKANTCETEPAFSPLRRGRKKNILVLGTSESSAKRYTKEHTKKYTKRYAKRYIKTQKG